MKTGMERFGALMTGALPDRVPIACNLLDQGAVEMGVPIRDYYASGELVAEAQLRLREKYGYDTLMGMFYSAMEAEVLGCRNIIYANDGPPNVGQLVINRQEDIDLLRVPDNLNEHPRFSELANCIRILKKESGGKYPVLGVVTASFSLPAMLMGIGAWMDLFLNGDSLLRNRLLEKCSRFCRMHITALQEAGADLIVYVNPVASATFIPQRIFRETALPSILNDLELSGPAGVIFFNGGGRINPILADLQQHTGIGAYYLNPFDDVTEARSILGDKALIAGTINDIRLIDWTVEEIDLEVGRIMQAGKDAGGFIFGTLLMPFIIPEANIRALMDSALRHGSYSVPSP